MSRPCCCTPTSPCERAGGQAQRVCETGELDERDHEKQHGHAFETAGVGVPSHDGWRWTANGGIAGEVSRAIGILESGAVPAYVSLPLTIE